MSELIVTKLNHESFSYCSSLPVLLSHITLSFAAGFVRLHQTSSPHNLGTLAYLHYQNITLCQSYHVK